MRRLLSMKWVPVALVASVLGVQTVELRAAPVPKPVDERPAKDVLKLGAASEIVERPGGYLLLIEVEYEATGARSISCPVYDENAGGFGPATCGEAKSFDVTEGRGKLAFTYFVPGDSCWAASISDGSFAQAWATPQMRLPTGELKAEAAGFLYLSAEGHQ